MKKARPIKNLLKYNKKVVSECRELGISGNHYIMALTWVDAITYVMDNYECTPKEQGQPYMPAKRLSGDQYYVEMKKAENVTSRITFDNKEDYEGFIKSMKENGNKITAQGELQALPFL